MLLESCKTVQKLEYQLYEVNRNTFEFQQLEILQTSKAELDNKFGATSHKFV